MEEKELLLKIENLEKRVSLLEKQLETIARINQSEKVKEYIASAEKVSKIAKLLDAATDKKTNDSQIENESISGILSSGSMMEKIDTAKDFVSDIDSNVEMQIRENNDEANKYDWDTLFDYEEVDDQITIKSYIGFDDMDVVVIPDRINDLMVTKIGQKAFANCENVKEVVLPKFLTTIGDSAFYDSGLTIISLPNSLVHIGDQAFLSSGLTTISLPKSLIHIGQSAFAFSKLEKINIPSKVERISDFAFGHCKSLKEISFKEGITSIGKGAFAGCRSLIKIDIPNSVNTIEENAFDENHIHLRIPNNCKKLGEWNENSFSTIFGSRYNAIIYCNAGSAAMQYARKHRIPVKRYEEFDLLEE